MIKAGVVIQYADGRPDKLLYEPQPKQVLLHRATEPYVFYGGAAGGGKSHGLRWHGILGCYRHPQFNVLLLRRTFPELDRTHLRQIPREVPREIAHYNAGKHCLTFPSTGSIMQFGHCQDEKAWRLYLSDEYDIIIIDEAGTFTPYQLTMLKTRLRTTNPRVRPQYVLGSNPGGEGHLWLKQRFISRKPDPMDEPNYDTSLWRFIPARVQDNKYVGEDYIRELMNLPEAERKAYYEGDWDTFAGQYFQEWSHSVHVVEAADQHEIPDWWEVEAGMDWGYDPHPGGLGIAGMDNYGRPTVYREIMFRQTPPDAVAEMIVDQAFTPMEKRMLIRGDPSMWARNPKTGVSIADEMNMVFADRKSGITLIQANNDRINGWMRVHQYLDTRRPDPDKPGETGPWMKFYAMNPNLGYGCPYAIETIPIQMHDEIKPGDLKKGATDHAADWIRYLLMGRPPLSAIPIDKLPARTHTQKVHARTQKIMEEAMERHNRRMEGTEGDFDLEVDGEYEDEASIVGIEDLFT